MIVRALLFLTLLLLPTTHAGYLEDIRLTETGGGKSCAACTIVVTLLEQVILLKEKPAQEVLDEVCDYFPQELSPLCKHLVNTYGGAIVKLLGLKFKGEEICHSLNICTDPTCRLFPDTKERPIPSISLPEPTLKNPWDWLKDLVMRIADHKPIMDVDGDLFSMLPPLRGSNWRGRDCNDYNADEYPGRRVSTSSSLGDHNCNGIHGKAPNGSSWESLYCEKSQPRGTVILGDSAGANFGVPPEWLTASEISLSTYSNLLSVLANEVDWPHQSAITGFVRTTTDVPVSSIYQKMVERNRCNHRDYQNVAVNGARSNAMKNKIIKTLARNQTLDHPMLVFFALIGNDVCSPHHDLGRMTTVEQFRENILESLNYLEKTLPKGSHVVLSGLANGLVLWDSLHNRTHPIGATYKNVYNFLNCLGLSPCWVWMNSNETIRQAGQKRADELSAVYQEIVDTHKFKNFDMAYYKSPFNSMVDDYVSRGGHVWELIEPVDGFHPNQKSNALYGEHLWKILSKDHPDFLGPVNPFNEAILERFGDQGGY